MERWRIWLISPRGSLGAIRTAGARDFSRLAGAERRGGLRQNGSALPSRILGFVAGRFDQVFGVTIPLLQDLQRQAPQAVCDVFPANLPRTLLVNRTAPPFDNPELRRAMALSLDHQAFIDIITLGQGDIGGAMQPPPEGVWGMPREMLRTLPGYDPDVAKNRAQARGIMEKLGYGPDDRLAVKVSARNIAPTRDPAVLLIGQLKEI